MTAALITGAARGLGLEVGRQLARLGIEVHPAVRPRGGRDRGRGPTWCAGRTAAVGRGRSGSGDAAGGAWQSDPGGLDILINSAAGYVDWSERASTADLTAADQVLGVNLSGSWRMTQAFLPLLRRSPHPCVGSGAGSHADASFGLTARQGAAATYGISNAALTATLAAPGVVWAATLPDDGPRGGFFRDGEPLGW